MEEDLAALLDFAERSRAGDWSLRSALTRYAQGQPQRVSDLLEHVRRIQAVLPKEPADLDPALLDVVREVDAVGDALATWACDPWVADRPDAEVDRLIASLGPRLDDLGVPREERTGPPRGARRRG